MQAFLNFLTQNPLLLLLGLFFCFFVVIILIFRSFKKSQKQHLETLAKTQEDIFKNASKILVEDLKNFAFDDLNRQVESSYKDLIALDLLPSVKTAGETLQNLAEGVINRQESGMAELADKLAGIFTQKTDAYLEKEAEVIFKINESVKDFGQALAGVNENINLFASQYNDIYDKANRVSESLVKSAENIDENFTKIEDLFEKSALLFENAQKSVATSAELMANATDTSIEIRDYVSDAVKTLSLSQKTTAGLLSHAVEAMQKNTEQAAESVLGEFKSALLINNEVLSETINSLQNLAEGMQEISKDFSSSLYKAYEDFDKATSDKTLEISKAFAEATDSQYKKIIDGINEHSKGFTENINVFNNTFLQELGTLQTLSRHLNNTLASFKTDADASSERFETGIEQIVKTALKEMDTSLAEIIDRLVSVTASISEAADAIPRAVNSIKNAK